MGVVFNLAVKNLSRQKRRNVVLVLAIAIGFFVVTGIDAFASGIVENVENQLTQLVGGTVLIQGVERIPAGTEGEKDSVAAIIREGDYLKEVVEKNNIKYKSISYYSQTVGQMIFEGKKSLITVYGRNLEEKDLIDSFQFISGGIENFSDPKALVISDKTASSLNLEVGDVVTYTCSTIYGQNTVEDFTVAGIIRSNSFIGTLQSYCHLKTLNNLIGLPEDGYSTFTINLDNKKKQDSVAYLIENAIRKDGKNVTSFLEAVKTNPVNIGRGIEKQIDVKTNQWEGTKYAVESLYQEIPSIKTVLFYIHTVSLCVLIVILFIVMIGVSNTYRIVMYERIREIGTMRALGMNKKRTKWVFTLEAIVLCVLGALIGLALCFAVISILRCIPFYDEKMLLLLYKNHLVFKVSIGTIILQYLLLILFTILAVRRTAKKAASLSPAEALRTVK